MIQAIETVYKGYRFRSRLEARWAIFLDCLSIHWEYEKEGFDLGDGMRYLPDFYLSASDPDNSLACWLEIKPITPTIDETEKMCALAIESETPVVCVWGVPDIAEWHASVYMSNRIKDSYYFFHITDGYMATFSNHLQETCIADRESLSGIRWPFGWTGDMQVIDEACRTARAARFEFGESGLPDERIAERAARKATQGAQP